MQPNDFVRDDCLDLPKKETERLRFPLRKPNG